MHSIMKVLFGLVVMLCLAMVRCQDNDNNSNQDIRMKIYKVYMKLHNRTWVEEELPLRLEYYWNRRQKVLESVKKFNEGKSSFSLAENDFMDMSDEERDKYKFGGVNMPSKEQLEKERAEDEKSAPSEGPSSQGNAPDYVDWREKGCIHPAMNQGTCGSCYAAAVRGALEGMRCLKHGESPELSHQQIVDCASDGYGNNGCSGGWPHDSLKYLQDASYISVYRDYPATDRQDSCKTGEMNKGSFIKASPTDQEKLQFKTYYNEDDMKEAVAKVGPTIMFVQASDNFMDYGSGVFDGDDCGTEFEKITHVVVAMGYGTENGKDYWLLKNSWGPEWGQDGYMKMIRGKSACGIGGRAHAITA